jgi:hypothetical protein
MQICAKRGIWSWVEIMAPVSGLCFFWPRWDEYKRYMFTDGFSSSSQCHQNEVLCSHLVLQQSMDDS